MRTHWITHGGHKILYSDYSELGRDLDALSKEIAASEGLCMREPDASVLNFVNVEGTVASLAGVEMLKRAAIAKRSKVKKTAVIGITGVRQLLAQGIAKASGTDIRYFDTREAALEWLLKD